MVATDILSDWQIVIVLMMNSVRPAGTVIDVPARWPTPVGTPSLCSGDGETLEPGVV